MDVSDLETTSNSDEEPGAPSTRSKVAGRKDRSGRRSLRRSRRGNYDEDFDPNCDEVEYGAWTKSECLKVEKGLMTFGYESFIFSTFVPFSFILIQSNYYVLSLINDLS